jgi:hypothetical protein
MTGVRYDHDAIRARRLDAIRADRARRGLPPTIQSLAVYRLLSACLDANRPARDDEAAG